MPAERTIVKREYDEDETNTETASTMVMYTKAAHWHARPDVNVEFIATDPARATIPYVQLTSAGQTTEYLGEGVTARPAGELRRMDCTDCHNRPAHTMALRRRRPSIGPSRTVGSAASCRSSEKRPLPR